MNDHVDDAIRRLAAAPTDHFLGGLEAELSSDIGARLTEARLTLALTRVGAAVVAMALALGLTVGGVTAAAAGAAHGMPRLAGPQRLAPSTLLDSAR